MPTITCRNVSCAAPGVVIPLVGTCNASDPSAVLVYFVDGVNTATLTCPAANTTVTVTVQPVLPTRPTCPYNATMGFNVTSERRWRPDGFALAVVHVRGLW
jgi:hypothetical protein